MILQIKGTNIELAVSLKEYVERKIGSLDRFLKRWETEGEIEAWLEIGRTTRHHQKGNVFRAEVTIRMPGKIVLRAEEEDSDVRAAIDNVRDRIFHELERYKEKQGVERRARRKKAE